jgi:hypothetical protein
MGGPRGKARRGEVRFIVEDEELLHALNASQEGVGPALREAFYDVGSFLVREMRANMEAWGTVDTGGTLESIQAEITGRRGRLTLVVGPDADHAVIAATLETGRTPGSKLPPIGALLPWMARHNIPSEDEYPIIHAIAKYGLAGQPFPFAEPALTQGLEEIEQMFNDALDAVESDWTDA